MSADGSSKRLMGTGVFSAFAASLCCIAPVLALVAGSSGFASTFSWLDPFRPYFIALTVLVLGFAWYQKLKPKKETEIACKCEESEKASFWQSKKFLGIITVFAALMLAFPVYADSFFPKHEKQVAAVESSDIKSVEFQIEGMTCTGCEATVNHEVNKLKGIINTEVSYERENAIITFDHSQTSIDEIEKEIKSTGYEVIRKRERNDGDID